MSRFTKEQIQELEVRFGLKQVESAVAIVSDGAVTPDMKVWWKSSEGRVRVLAMEHWDNILSYPNFYSIKEPSVRVIIYED